MRVCDCDWLVTWYQSAASSVGCPSGNTMVEYSATTADEPGGGHIVAKLKSRMIEQSLPLWAKEGWDPATGGFVERLDQEGRADRLAPRRIRGQAREIYFFAKATHMGRAPA